jgi:hypothetical protein
MSSHRKYKRGNKVMHFRVGMDTFFSSFPDWNFSGPFHPSKRTTGDGKISVEYAIFQGNPARHRLQTDEPPRPEINSV